MACVEAQQAQGFGASSSYFWSYFIKILYKFSKNFTKFFSQIDGGGVVVGSVEFFAALKFRNGDTLLKNEHVAVKL